MGKAIAYLSVPVTKRRNNADGSVTISGPVTDDSLDLDGQIVDPTSAAKALQDWFDDFGNIRQQHSAALPPAGKALSLKFVNGVPNVVAKIVETEAVKLVKAGVYQAFSIGIADGKIDRSPEACMRAPNGVIYPSLINETSVVDYPANVAMGKFLIAKRRGDGHIEPVGLTKVMDRRLRGLAGDELVEAWKGLAAKRDISGADRKKIPDEDFAGKGDSYPIEKPADVAAAASSIGRAGDDNYSSDELKRNIIAIARRKGPRFVAELPDSWKDSVAKKKAKAPAGTDDGKPTDGDSGEDTGKKPAFPGAAKPFGKKPKKKTKAAKGAIPDVDEAVTDDLADAEDAIESAISDQDDDNRAHITGDDADDQDKAKAKAKAKAKKAKAAKAKKLAKGPRIKKGRLVATKSDIAHAQGVHDLLCPACRAPGKRIAKSLGQVIDAERFAERLRVAARSEVTAGTLTAAGEAALAANRVAQLSAKDYRHLSGVARKTLANAYPDLKIGSVDPANPASFRRPFLASANSDQAKGGGGDKFPDSHPLSAGSIDRGPLTTNQARPTLTPGVPASSLVGKSAPARAFYTNAAKDESAQAMATLHDHIVANYPTVCPAAGMADELTDRLGTPPEMYSHAPGVAHLDAKAASTGASVADERLVAATKRAKVRIGKQAKQIKRLRSDLRELRKRPDLSQAAPRSARFAEIPKAATKTNGKLSKSKRRARQLAELVRDNDASPEQLIELQRVVNPNEYAAVLTGGVDER